MVEKYMYGTLLRLCETNGREYYVKSEGGERGPRSLRRDQTTRRRETMNLVNLKFTYTKEILVKREGENEIKMLRVDGRRNKKN